MKIPSIISDKITLERGTVPGSMEFYYGRPFNQVEDYSIGIEEKWSLTGGTDGNPLKLKSDGYNYLWPKKFDMLYRKGWGARDDYTLDGTNHRYDNTYGAWNAFAASNRYATVFNHGLNKEFDYDVEHNLVYDGLPTYNTGNNDVITDWKYSFLKNIIGRPNVQTNVLQHCLAIENPGMDKQKTYNLLALRPTPDVANYLLSRCYTHDPTVYNNFKISINGKATDYFVNIKPVLNTFMSDIYNSSSMNYILDVHKVKDYNVDTARCFNLYPNYGCEAYKFANTLYTLEHIERNFNVCFNDNTGEIRPIGSERTFRLEFGIVGTYMTNGVRVSLYDGMDVDLTSDEITKDTTRYIDAEALRKIINDIFLDKDIRVKYNSFDSIINAAISKYNIDNPDTAIDIDYIEHANLYVAQLFGKKTEQGWYDNPDFSVSNVCVLSDVMLLEIYTQCSNEPDWSADLGTITLQSPRSLIRPQFLVNNKSHTPFDMESLFDAGVKLDKYTIKNIEYSEASNKTTLDLEVEGLIPKDLKLDTDSIGTQLSTSDVRIIPPIQYYQGSKLEYKDVTNWLFTDKENPITYEYPSRDTAFKDAMYLSAKALVPSGSVYTSYTNSDGLLTLGSWVPMSHKETVGFTTKRNFKVELDGKEIDGNFILNSDAYDVPVEIPFLRETTTISMSYERVDNGTECFTNGYQLYPYMYDRTIVAIKLFDNYGNPLKLTPEQLDITIVEKTGTVYNFNMSETSKLAEQLVITPGIYKEEDGVYTLELILPYRFDMDGTYKGFKECDVTIDYKHTEEEIKEHGYDEGTVATLTYDAMLPPYIVQGIPFTEVPGTEEVLDNPSSTARVDYSASPYNNSREGWETDMMFNNPAKTLYKVIASAYLPNDSKMIVDDVASNFISKVSDTMIPLSITASGSFTSALNIARKFTPSTDFGDDTSSKTYTAPFTINTYTQDIDVSDYSIDYISDKIEIEGLLITETEDSTTTRKVGMRALSRSK